MTTGMSPSAVHHCGDERDEIIEDRPQQQPPNRPSRATIQPHRGGYDCEFVKPPSVDFPQTDCPVCLLVLREPHQASCCGTSYCEACVKRVKEDKKCCPTCNEADFTIFPDKRLKRSLYALNVYCCQRREGCEWEGELGELDRHLNLQPPPEKRLVGCQFAEVDCTYCVQPFQRRYVQAHQSNDCIKRPYTCQHCDKCAATFEEVTQDHWPVCPFFPLSCPNNCELVLQRQEVEDHMSQDCPLTLVQCDFHVVGCQIELPRRDMSSHINENLTGHMSLLQMHMTSHPEENMATHMCLMVGSTQKVVMENANIRSELHETQEKLQQMCDELQKSHGELQKAHDELHGELKKSQESMAQLAATVTSLIATHAKEMQESQEKIETQEAKLIQHQKALEKVTCAGTLPFEFTMTDFEQHKGADDEWCSPVFYTHTHGYRMRISVYANGHGSGKGTHVALFTCIMEGPFDSDLKWPFRGNVTIQLVNQAGGNDHERTISYTDETPDECASMMTDLEKSIEWGFHQFLSHNSLGYNASRNTHYLQGDSLQFRISKVELKK